MRLKTTLTIAILLLMTACATRPDRPHIEIPNPEKRLILLKKRLEMTDAQVEAVRPILQSEYEQKTALLEKMHDADSEAAKLLRQQNEDLEWDIYKQLSEHLDPDQMYLYSFILDEEEQARQNQIRERMASKRSGGRKGGF